MENHWEGTFSGYWISTSRKYSMPLFLLLLSTKYLVNWGAFSVELKPSTGNFCDISHTYRDASFLRGQKVVFFLPAAKMTLKWQIQLKVTY